MEIWKKIGSFLLDSIQTFLMAAAVFLVIYMFFFRPFQVSGDSMYPNFIDKEYVLTNLISLRFNPPVKGDVVVFKAPQEEEKDFIKRVIGVPGDTVEIRDGVVYVNGQLLDESKYLKPTVKTYGGAFLQDSLPVTVPPDNYVVLGDNRLFSSDSREWGFVPKNKLIGLSSFVYWPINHMKVIENPYKN